MSLKAIEFIQVSKCYADHLAIDQLSCVVQGNGVWGLLGPNGAGKSTFMHLLCGILPVSRGTIVQRNITQIGFAPEIAPLYYNMTVKNYLIFCQQLRGVPAQEVERVVQRLSLSSVSDKIIATLSRGYRQRVNLAQALLGDPVIIVLDEPFVGLDPSSRQEIRQIIQELGIRHLVIISSHQLREIEDICTNFLFLYQGKLVEQGTKQQLQEKIFAQAQLVIEMQPMEQQALDQFIQYFSARLINSSRHADSMQIILEYADCLERRSEIVNYLYSQNIKLFSLQLKTRHLEEIFQRMVNDG